ncbi:cation:proton antiporter [Agromyces aurantiacus]|uniref:Cation:proton antiporter n=1 Tax=Agromyces aurantiacus TaxID=165814 RepID=A0ABV9R3R9_9MICO|nr:cation:proton antiporter [Agromyces aurantiacus]MBM7502774.1 NhaP-type Na+/H+ or K+/H+ antiporter [Agromyces aurantiacus]
MPEATFAVLMLVILGWAVVSDRLARWNVTGPMVFTVFGFVLANQDWGPLTVDVEAPSIHLLAELTLALLLFSDAARVNLSTLRHDIGVPARLLGIGLPLTIVLGSLVAAWLFRDFSWALAGFVGAALAPTDAALSAQVINDERIPTRVRRALNVESGLNDGIVTPIVVFTLAVAAGELEGEEASATAIQPVLELAIGVLVGLVIGFVAAKLIAFASRRSWVLPGARRLATLAAAVGSFAVAGTVGGNGFIAAFIAGMVFGAALPREVVDPAEVSEFPELLGEVLSLAVWFLFGAALLPVVIEYFSVWTLVYAALSLTVIRLLPVAIGMLGTGQDRATVLFIGWFGPRGLASVVFALLAIEELGPSSAAGPAIAAVAFTVLVSVIIHGVTAGPIGRRYGSGHTEVGPAVAAPRARRQSHR